MFPLKRLLALILLLLFFNGCTTYTSSNKKFSISSPTIILSASTILNPAIGLGSFAVNSSAAQRAYSAADLAFMASNYGESIAEKAISKSTNQDCSIGNYFENNNICIKSK